MRKFLTDEKPMDTQKTCLASDVTKIEKGIMTKLAHGKEITEIADFYGISPHTVKAHIGVIMRKIGARNRTHAVFIALHNKWIK